MTDATFNTIEQYVSDNAATLKNFTDRTDADLLESLGEYGFVRNPETNEVVYKQMFYAENEGIETVSIKQTTVDLSAVKDALEDAPQGYFDYIGSDAATEIESLDNNNLASSILSLQQYQGEFWQSSN